MSDHTRVLHVDDDPGLTEVTAEFLEREGEDFVVETATGAAEGLDRLSEAEFDCVVSDYEMPGRDGIEFLERVREDHPDLPFVLYTGKGSEEVASDAISAGVTDYLQKGRGTDQYTVLANRIENAVEAYRSERALAERTRRLETLISNVPGMVYRCRNEPDWPMENVEGEVAELTGYSADALERGEVLWGEDVIHPEDRERMWEAVQEALDDGEPFEVTYRIHTRDGQLKWAWERGRGVYDEDGSLDALEGFITDITEREQRERALERYRQILEATDDVAFVLDRDLVVRYVNGSITDYVDVGVDDIVGESVEALAAEFAVEDDALGTVETGVERALAASPDDDPVRFELDLDVADGVVTFEYQLSPLPDDADVTGVVATMREVTDRKRRERELRLAKERLERQNQRLDEFASFVSHDLQNPLDVAEGHLELARERHDDDHLAAVAGAHDRMRSMIDDLLALAREGGDQQEVEPVSLAAHARGCWDAVDTGDADLVVETDAVVPAEGAGLDQLLENLFRNAVEHGSTSPQQAEDAVEHGSTSSDSQARRDAAGTSSDEPSVADAPEDAVEHDSTNPQRAEGDAEHGGDGVTVTVGDLEDGFYVADDGPGIPEEQREEVFEAGYSTSSGGTGYGLRIVERIAATHGWTVALEESSDGGARFEFRDVTNPE